LKVRITNISSRQSSLMVAILVAVLMIPLSLIVAITLPFSNNPLDSSLWVMFFLPFVYGLIVYVFCRIFCLVYNFVASKCGGIEFTIDES
jgi:ABC-type spermidine/putrescine transport system permease subunit II